MVSRLLRTGEFYGNVSQRLNCSGFLLSELRHSCERALPDHSHESAYFSLLLQGEYSERIGSKELPYSVWAAAFHPPQMAHRDRIGNRGARFFTIEVKDEWIQRLREMVPGLQLTAGFCSGDVKWLISRLYFRYRDPGRCSALGIEEMSLEILATLARAKGCQETRRPDWLTRAEELLHAESHRNVSLDEIAKAAGVHPVYFSRVFRRTHRQSIAAYVNQIRIQNASERLRQGGTPLAEIAVYHGFADQSHFTRVFKKITGSTPSAFRRAVQGNGTPDLWAK